MQENKYGAIKLEGCSPIEAKVGGGLHEGTGGHARIKDGDGGLGVVNRLDWIASSVGGEDELLLVEAGDRGSEARVSTSWASPQRILDVKAAAPIAAGTCY